ncbi:MAG: DNA methyltransferase [Sandaracinaceae bacterium]
MSEVEKRFHESWLGMVQPVEGLVVSVPVLVDAQCMARQAPETQAKLIELCPASREGSAGPEGRAIADLERFFSELLDLTPDLFDAGRPTSDGAHADGAPGAGALPDELTLWVPEGRQSLRPTMGLRRLEPPSDEEANAPDSTPASRAGSAYVALVWDVAAGCPEAVGMDLDKAETLTGPWEYPASAKFDRLLRHCRVPVGILTNREVVRLVFAPHGESSGHLTFRLDDMASVGGRPILDAFVMLLSGTRFFGVAEEHALPALLAESRKRQANVTSDLAEQVFDALQILLRGFEAAAERDGHTLIDDALQREGDHLYQGLLTVLLRLVFILYAEDRGLLPVDHPSYAEHQSLLGLFDRLQADQGAYPDSMSRRFGAYAHLVALFRQVFLGVDHEDLSMPPRRGALFDPNTYPFLEGWGPAGAAPIVVPEHRADVRVPTVDDETVYRVLEKLLVFEGQRLSYRTLDVEQIGSVYEALMGFHVVRLPAPAVCLRPNGVWMTAEGDLPAVADESLGEVAKSRRANWVKEHTGLSKAQATKLVKALADEEGLEALRGFAVSSRKRERHLTEASAGQLVLQPGAERRRTSSHYTPRSLSAPIVRRTLEPLLACMGEAPRSDLILELKVCDPAMGSGAFLVEACRFLADQLVAAWTREGKLEEVAAQAPNEDPVLHARRLVAQRCLYGVDKNASAVELAKLSLWLVTLARDLPFTFVDHALRHGDSLVGLSFDQIRAFHWKPEKQLGLAEQVLREALDEAIAIRQAILDLAGDGSPEAQREKERLLVDAADASRRARLIADVCVGAFFAEAKSKAREAERDRRLGLVQRWLDGDDEAGAQLEALQHQIRERLPVFHWMLEFPEVFHAERPDPLEDGKVNRAAFMDAFVGNPPFMGQASIVGTHGERYRDWLFELHTGAGGKADLVAHFFRRSAALLGSHGTVGLIATNTIAQGDTREAGLQPMLQNGWQVYAAVRSMPWPGEAAVTVAVVHLALGSPQVAAQPPILDGTPAECINSRLRQGKERPDPTKLSANTQLSFLGCKIGGQGFLIDSEVRRELIEANATNGERVFEYLGGQEVNSSPTQSPHRFVIDFAQMSLSEAERWPELLDIVRREVKPYRETVRRDTWRKRWWQFAEVYPSMRAAIAPLDRCLVTGIVSKHLMFSFQPTDRIFSHRLYVFPLPSYTAFAILQSRVHEGWTWLLSSTLEERLNYSASDCFETFPFPAAAPRTVHPDLEAIGERLYETRAAHMVDADEGLTTTYNKLKDPDCTDAPIVELRRLHEEMDAAVLAAYGWDDLEAPPYCPATPAEERAVEAFSDAVIDRLFVLNSERAEDERRRGLGSSGKRGKTKKTSKRGGKKKAKSEQGSLDLD